MKRILIVLILSGFIYTLNAQELDSLKAILENKDNPQKDTNQSEKTISPVIVNDDDNGVSVKLGETEIVKVIDKPDSTVVSVGPNKEVEVIDNPDTTHVKIGDKDIQIVDKDGNPRINIQDQNNGNETFKTKKFKGHWAGLEWGLNNFVDANNNISGDLMDLNTSRSICLNINMTQYSIGFGTNHIGLVTGLGLGYNNYFFDGNKSIQEKNDYIVSDTLGSSVSKSKLTAVFLRVPLMLEVQIPNVKRSKRIYLSAGLIGGLKLGSHTKIVYKDDNGKNKDKNNDDFNINPFRYGVTARIGYHCLNIFGDYYFTPFFVKNKGPELHPFSVGLSMTF